MLQNLMQKCLDYFEASIVYLDKCYCSFRIKYTICFSIESFKYLCLNVEQIKKIKDFDKQEKRNIIFFGKK